MVSGTLYFHSLVEGATFSSDRNGSQSPHNLADMSAIPLASLANSGFQCAQVTGDSSIPLTWMSLAWSLECGGDCCRS